MPFFQKLIFFVFIPLINPLGTPNGMIFMYISLNIFSIRKSYLRGFHVFDVPKYLNKSHGISPKFCYIIEKIITMVEIIGR